MKNILAILITVVAFTVTLVVEAKVKMNVNFTEPRIFLPLKGAKATAGYVGIKNDGDQEVVLTLKSVEGFKAVELHETVEKDSQMVMQKVDSFKIPAFTKMDLVPGGKHIMLFEPTREFKEGEKVQAIFMAGKHEIKLPLKMVTRDANESVHSGH